MKKIKETFTRGMMFWFFRDVRNSVLCFEFAQCMIGWTAIFEHLKKNQNIVTLVKVSLVMWMLASYVKGSSKNQALKKVVKIIRILRSRLQFVHVFQALDRVDCFNNIITIIKFSAKISSLRTPFCELDLSLHASYF